MTNLSFALLLAAVAAPAFAQMPVRDPAAIFDQADTNHDGRVSRAEFIAARSAHFARLDRNGDGVISSSDFPRIARFRPQAVDRIDRLISEDDANHDGKLTPAELAAAPTPLFDRADSNHDGFVDKAEAAAIRSELRVARSGN